MPRIHSLTKISNMSSRVYDRGSKSDDVLNYAESLYPVHLHGRHGDDALFGGAGRDKIFGGWGDDQLTGGAGGDVLHGGRGFDTAHFAGSIEDYGWSELGRGRMRVDGPDGRDLLVRIEALAFDDYTFVPGGDNAPLVTGDDVEGHEDTATGFVVEARDFDGGLLSVESASVTGGGSLSLEAATGPGDARSFAFRFDPGAAYQDLAEGATANELVTLRIADGQGNVTEHILDLAIEGANDAPRITSVTPASPEVQEDGVTQVSGQILADDPDAGDTLFYGVDGAQTGAFGAMAVTADTGAWTYTLDNDAPQVQTLNDGEVVIDSFVFAARDGGGLSDTAGIDIAVRGADEAELGRLLTFEDVSVDDSHVLDIEGEYAGFTWLEAARVMETDEYKGGSGTTYHDAAVSGQNVIYNTWSRDLTLSRAESFDLQSASVAAAVRDGMTLTVTAYADGLELGQQSITLSRAPQSVEFDDALFDDVDAVTFSTPYASLGQFVMDDILIFG